MIKGKDILKVIKPEVLKLSPYTFEVHPCRIKLNQNECPYDLPAELKDALLERVRGLEWSRYPKPFPEELHDALAKLLQLDEEIDILIGNGSNELIQMMLLVMIERGAKVIIPTPTFALYRIISTILGATAIEVPLKDDLTFDVDRIIEAARDNEARIIFLCRPNNPTGGLIPSQDVRRIAQETEALLVIDEAYYEFSGETSLPLLKDFSNIVILRTFSKALGAAGLRIGYLLGQTALVNQVAKAKLPFNLNIVSQEAALVILRDRGLFKKRIEEIISGREYLYRQLKRIEGIRPFPSWANFICFYTKKPAKALFEALLERGILIRDISHYPMLSDCLRVTVGTEAENREFIKALKELMEGTCAIGKLSSGARRARPTLG